MAKRLVTEIGSLPHHNVDAALEHSFGLTLPFLPQIPVRNPRETMVAQALWGFPGLELKSVGMVTINLDRWAEGARDNEARLERALGDESALALFEPPAEAASCWKPFLFEVSERKCPHVKIQLAGPLTCLWVTRSSDGQPLEQLPEVASQIYRFVLARSKAMVRRVQETGAKVTFFIDEPALLVLAKPSSRYLGQLAELKLLVQSLKQMDAQVGIHCCSETNWSQVLALEPDFLSIDCELSLESLIADQASLKKFLASGGRLSLGVVGTAHEVSKSDPESPREWAKAALTDLGRLLPSQALDEALFTPSCGMALLTTEQAESTRAKLLALTSATTDTNRSAHFFP